MSNLVLVYDRKFQQHRNPDSHPESPDRLAALERALYAHQLTGQLTHLSPRPALEDELATVHDAAYVEELERASKKACETDSLVRPHADTNTWISPLSYDVAKLAAGAGLTAVDSVAGGAHTSAFVAARPPGHHALANRAYGFCLFNNVAVAARYAQNKFGIERVLIIDWDVHHGNGTQDLFYNDPSVCFISLHQYPLWPADCGWFTEEGRGEGRGFNINIPLPAGTGDRGYFKAWDSVVQPIALEYKPGMIILSAGYDAHQYDPLGQQQVTTGGYRQLSGRLLDLSYQTRAGIVCFLEGGYNTQTTAESAVTTMSVLNSATTNGDALLLAQGKDMDSIIKPSTRDRSESFVDQQIDQIRKHYSRYWRSLRSAEKN